MVNRWFATTELIEIPCQRAFLTLCAFMRSERRALIVRELGRKAYLSSRNQVWAGVLQ